MPNTVRPGAFDVIVIGNGALGCSIAYRLKASDKTLKVAIIGPAARKGAATTTAGAMINVWAELAPGQFDDPVLADRAELTISGGCLWDDYCAELSESGSHPIDIKWGTYVINNSRGSPHERRAVDYMLDVMQKRQINHRLCDPSEIKWLKPEITGEATRIVWIPDGRIDSREVLKVYERAFRNMSVEQIDATVEELQATNNNRSVKLSDGTTLSAKHIVLANGSFAQSLIDQVLEIRNATPRLLWGAGSAVDLAFPPWIMRDRGGLERNVFDMDAVVRTVDRGGACGIHVVPYGEGKYYLGASSGVWFEPEPSARVHAVEVLLRSVVEEINYGFFYANMEVRGPGHRPTSVDTFPLLGQSHVPGIWFANGTKRDGFTCSPLIANELVAEMLGQRRSRLPERFRPSRKVISYKTKAAALDDAVSANVGGEYQHGLKLPPYAVEGYRAHKREQYEAIYRKRNLSEFGIHPEVLHIYENDQFFAAVDIPRELN